MGRYDAAVPNKTIYVSDGDLPVYRRAQELGGGNLSAAIAVALRRYVEVEESRKEGFDEIIVRVGARQGPQGPVRRRPPRRVAQHDVTAGSERVPCLSRPDRQARPPHRAQPGFTTVDAEGKPAGWRGYLGIGNISYGSTPGESTLEVFESFEELREKIPPRALRHGRRHSAQPAVEDLDI